MSSNTIDVTQPPYNAAGDGQTINTDAFQDAIWDLNATGGGTLLVPSGDYVIGPINLTSHMVLYLYAGAKLLGVQNKSLYPLIAPLPNFGTGREDPYNHERRLSLIEIPNATNVTIQGEGDESIIDGQGEYWWDLWNNGELNYTRPHLIETMWSSDVNFYDFQMGNSGFWTNHWFDTENIHVKNVNINSSLSGPNTDGWDPDSSRNILIEDSSYTGGDDCVAIKAGWGCYGSDYGVPTKNVTVRNVTCNGNGGSAGLAIGSEMNGGVENVLFENITLNDSNYVANLKHSTPGGGYFENITYKDIIINGDLKQAARSLYIYLPGNPLCDASDYSKATYNNINFINIDGREVELTEEEKPTYGFGVSPIENSYWENVRFKHRMVNNWVCPATSVTYLEGTLEPEPSGCANVTVIPAAQRRRNNLRH